MRECLMVGRNGIQFSQFASVSFYFCRGYPETLHPNVSIGTGNTTVPLVTVLMVTECLSVTCLDRIAVSQFYLAPS